MRDYRDAKAMARTLRETLAAKHHKITVGESLEIIARLFGAADWNTLSAVIKNSERMPKSADARGRDGHVQFAPTTEQALHRALNIASDQGHSQTTVEHLLLSLIKDPDASAIMTANAVDFAAVREQITRSIEISSPSDGGGAATDPVPSPAFQRVVQRAIRDVLGAGGGNVTGAHLLAAIISDEKATAARILREHGLK
jgi:hypothetical protein